MVMPKQGDLIFIDAEPHAGHEEGGHNPEKGNIRRPMVVLSNDGYNSTGMIVGMPITSKTMNDMRIYLPIANHESGIQGTIITFLIPNYDYTARHGEIVGKVPASTLNILLERVHHIF